MSLFFMDIDSIKVVVASSVLVFVIVAVAESLEKTAKLSWMMLDGVDKMLKNLLPSGAGDPERASTPYSPCIVKVLLFGRSKFICKAMSSKLELAVKHDVCSIVNTENVGTTT